MPLFCNNYYKAFHNLMTDEVAVYYKIQIIFKSSVKADSVSICL
jgi:hypothetical protein